MEIEDMAYYETCPWCGANLDPGERCDCREAEGRGDKKTDFDSAIAEMHHWIQVNSGDVDAMRRHVKKKAALLD